MAKNKKINLKSIAYSILSILIIIILFAYFDFLVHLLNEEYAVPDYYFTNKIIYGTIWGLISYFILIRWNTKLSVKSFIFSTFISIVLQLRYAYEGYPMSFVIEFLFFHFFILWPVSYLVFKLFKKRVEF